MAERIPLFFQKQQKKNPPLSKTGRKIGDKIFLKESAVFGKTVEFLKIVFQKNSRFFFRPFTSAPSYNRLQDRFVISCGL